MDKEKEIIYIDELAYISETDIKLLKDFYRYRANYNYFLKLLRELRVFKENWNKLKEYIKDKKLIYDKRIPTEFCTNELIGKRMLAEELIYKMNKLENGGE